MPEPEGEFPCNKIWDKKDTPKIIIFLWLAY